MKKFCYCGFAPFRGPSKCIGLISVYMLEAYKSTVDMLIED